MRDDWTTQGDLFTPGGAPVGPAPDADAFRELAARLPGRLRLGTSSWSFPGWAGFVYDRAAKQGMLSRHGLRAYARHPLLTTVCVDRSWYGPLDRDHWRRWAEQTPEGFRFVIKADRALTWPGGAPDGRPPAFLDPDHARREVLDPAVEGLGGRLAVVLFQFPPVDPDVVGGPRGFAEGLYRFFQRLPAGPVRYAVEIRTPALLTGDYADALRHGGAVHGYVVHPRAPTLDDQLALLPAGGTGTTGRGGSGGSGGSGTFVLRWMLRTSLGYDEARDLYEPFADLQDPDPATRDVIARAVLEGVGAGADAFVVANNKAEGSSPLTVVELARRMAEMRR